MTMTEEVLADLVAAAEGRLDLPRSEALKNTLTRMPEAADILREFEQILAGLRREAHCESAPAAVLRMVAGLLPTAEQPLPGSWLLAGLKRLAASLEFDSFATPAMGVRSGMSTTRQMLFSAEGLDIDVRVMPQDGAWRVYGQVLGSSQEGAAKLKSDHGLELITALNVHGEFAFLRLPRGNYQLEVVQPGRYVDVPAFGVGESTH